MTDLPADPDAHPLHGMADGDPASGDPHAEASRPGDRPPGGPDAVHQPDGPSPDASAGARALEEADIEPAPEPAPDGSEWPVGWGNAPPVWTPPPAAGSIRPDRRPARLLLGVTGLLAIGAAAGAGIVVVHDHSSEGTGTAEIAIDSRPVSQTSGGVSVGVETVANELGPAVGTIVAPQTSGSGTALGSGFVISHANGLSYLVTNNHVVAGAQNLHVLMPDGRNLAATVEGTDVFDDIAVVSVKDATLPTAVFGHSSQLHVGQSVVAIGSPLGNQGSVTQGVISALHRTIKAGSEQGGSPELLQDVLQTDASINPGNSGGPLADMDGRVIGVNVAIAGAGTNIGYSIPSDVAAIVAESLIRHETVQHPFIGIGFDDELTATEAGKPFDGPGVLVTQVRDGSPAANAGIHVGDIITTVDGVSLVNGQTLGGVLQRHKVGDSIAMVVRRGGQTLTVSVTLVARPSGV